MPLPASSFEVPGAGSVSAVWTEVPDARWVLAYAPGAGSNLADPFGVFASQALARSGIATLRFAFPYMEARRRVPDRAPVLEATWRAAIDVARARAPEGTRLVVGGRSMGGRFASMVVAQGKSRVDALALFAYPLHPPKKPDELRVAHLGAIDVPTLFVSGTNDAFGTVDEISRAARGMKRAELRFLDRADHSFAVPKSTGRTRDEVFAEATDALVEWLAALG